ncbi:hypothetical protein CPB85DRAFT_1276316 [Mucidula mucida]|nr:hypothetical protein CPB85DRAFT_1276316 [Mucidula mucida]
MPKPAHYKYALDAHNNAKHPPTHHCHTCARAFREESYLNEHYRGSPAHPNCHVCGKGFKTDALCAVHIEEQHPKMDCALKECRITDVYEHQLREHYALSAVHPTCKVLNCDKGFFNAHLDSAHAEQTCVTCRKIFESVDTLEEHWRVSPLHTVCSRCEKGFDTLEAHMEVGFGYIIFLDVDYQVLFSIACQFTRQIRSLLFQKMRPGTRHRYVHSDKTVKTMSPVLESKRKTRANEKNTEKEEGVEPKAPPTWACQFTFQNTLVQDTDTDNSIDYAAWVEGLRHLSLLPPRVRRPSSSTQSSFNVRTSLGPRMHCRICTRDPCANASATLCGHVFCRACIMNAVVTSVHCPVCQQRLTVDCVFGLDLAN